ncbi:MAG: YciI family protein [Gemmatimonadaceae bacterium]|nr:YciI family protein [Gemmatimonadaceae bacterium]
MPDYMLLLHESTTAGAGLSPAEIMETINRYKAWAGKLAEAGKLRGGEKLCDDKGRVMTKRGAQVSAKDGPYSEVAEVIGGYFIINAADYAEAERLSSDCPHLDFGNAIELREVEPTSD